jgi:hypothetical protein
MKCISRTPHSGRLRKMPVADIELKAKYQPVVSHHIASSLATANKPVLAERARRHSSKICNNGRFAGREVPAWNARVVRFCPKAAGGAPDIATEPREDRRHPRFDRHVGGDRRSRYGKQRCAGRCARRVGCCRCDRRSSHLWERLLRRPLLPQPRILRAKLLRRCSLLRVLILGSDRSGRLTAGLNFLRSALGTPQPRAIAARGSKRRVLGP